MKKLNQICALIINTNPNVSNLVLQKLLYFIQAYQLVTTGQPAFDNKIEAWTYGPVVPDAYYTFKYNRENFDVFFGDLESKLRENIITITNGFTKQGLDPFDLVRLTHSYRTWQMSFSDIFNKEITREQIREYHQSRGANIF